MRIINLASGSDGNLTYIESQSSKILIDDGLSCQETGKRLALIGVSPDQLDGILVTHQHVDHIKGVDGLSSKYNIPVFAHQDVWLEMNDKLKKVTDKNRKAYDGAFLLKDLEIHPIELPHDVKCFGYSVENNGSKVSIITDLGKPNEKILKSIIGSGLVYLEANYDQKMLAQGDKYPLALKRRIAGPHGHLSNDDSAECVKVLAQTGTRQIVLSHLSKENNTPTLAYQYVCEKISQSGIQEGVDIRIDVASPQPGVIFRLR